MDVYDTVRQFILQNIVGGDNLTSLSADTPLHETGILDSLAILTLISFLEERFQVDFESADVDAGGFRSLGSIARLVQSKIATQS
jgi:acyl carrier protein